VSVTQAVSIRNAVIVSGVKRLQGTASREVAATPAQCLALFEVVERYPVWYPEAVRRVVVTQRDDDGRASEVEADLHLVYGPVTRDFNRLLMAVRAEPPTVALVRARRGVADAQDVQVTWRVAEGPRTRIELRLDATLSVPRFLPVGGIGDGIAGGFVDAAARELARSG
jgi:Polyketide cyclase / dehydrase and lipid transport